MFVLTHTTNRYGIATRSEQYGDFADLSRRAFALGVIRFTELGDVTSGAIYNGSKVVAKYTFEEGRSGVSGVCYD